MTDTIEQRVAAGAAWLDEHEPGWERRIDLATLDLASSCRCVLGQLFAGKVSAHGSGYFWALDQGLEGTEELGFCAPLVEDHRDWPSLDEAWIALIKERFACGLLSDEAAS